MKYREGKPSYREYDSCYYELESQDLNELDLTTTKNTQPRIYFQLTKKTEMNVFIYGGQSRFDATESIIKDNMQAEAGKTYTFDATQGILVVAYPNKDVDT